MDNALKFLVVDDSKISRRWLIEMLPDIFKNKATIIEGTNGEEAISLYTEHQPDITFLDITMPVMNGFEALEKIIEINKNATVIIISADRQKFTKEKTLALGASAILNKPIDANEFRETLLGLLRS